MGEEHTGAPPSGSNSPTRQSDKQVVRRAATAAGIGTFVEFLDYASYSYLAITLATVFFPDSDSTAGLLNTFAIFAASFLLRPIGGIVWGHLGDRLGRRRILAITIIVMSLSTFCIGLVPGSDQIGMVAPVLLLGCRLVQSFSAGGEYSGAGAFVVEYAPSGKRGRYASVVPMAAAGGFLVASSLSTLLYSVLSEASMAAWGWRVPFLLAGPLGLVGLYIRRRLDDTPLFAQLERNDAVERLPLVAALRGNAKEVVLLFMVMALNAGGYYLLLSYTPVYLEKHAGLSGGTATLIVSLGLLLYVWLIPLAATLADRWGRRPVLLVASALFIVLTYPALALLSADSMVVIFAAFLLLLAMFALNDGTFPSYFAESLPTRARFTGFALSFNLGNTIFGGTAPYIATWLIDRTGSPRAPAFYLMALAAVALIAVLIGRETAHRDLTE